MKKTLTVNLNGRVFNIDEDAYELLEKYLHNLRVYFRKEKSASEIIADFEARIEELFSERIRSGYEVISIDQVEVVIGKMGRPEDFGDAEPEPEIKPEIQPLVNGKKNKKKLYRDIDDELFGGICSGTAAYFDWDTVAVRFITLILFFVSGGTCLLAYLIAWLIIPAAKTAEQKLKMRGEEVSVENIGRTVASETSSEHKIKNHSFGESFLDFIATMIKICLMGFGILLGLPLIFALLITIIVLFAVVLGVGGGLLALPFGLVGTDIEGLVSACPVWVILVFTLVIGIPLCSLIYLIVAYLAKLNPMPKSVKWTGFITWIVALMTLIYCISTLDLTRTNFKNLLWTARSKQGNYNKFIDGNGILTTRTASLPAFQVLKIDDSLMADIQLESVLSDSIASISMTGDENIVEKITWLEEGDKLKLHIKDNYFVKNSGQVKIKIICPNIKGIEMHSLGSLIINRQLHAADFFIDMDGAGNIEVDSLYCNSLRSKIKGMGSVRIKGRTTTASYNLKGAGEIIADEMEAQQVDAILEGIGEIRCNPIEKLDAQVVGIGEISYKNEPQKMHKEVIGIGRINQE